MKFSLQNISKSYSNQPIYQNFNIDIDKGIITCILGPSGCGKTTLLNILGGIIPPDSGIIEGIEGIRFSYIFQEPRLLPWKTVRGNIEFVLDDSLSKSERRRRATELIRKVELEKFADYYPSQLSGGMRQRVSIARAFACPSDVILMDEPLSGLDINLKQSMLDWFSQIWQSDRRTVIFVTHDVDEAIAIGNEIVVFSQAPVQILSHRTNDKHNMDQLKSELMQNLAYNNQSVK